MNKYTGSISIYFPCKLKSGFLIRRFKGRWNRWQQRQINYIHHSHTPLTDLMDKGWNRHIKESFLNVLQKSLARGNVVNKDCAPFALKCLRLAYRKNREDNLFAKNVQVVLSRFSMQYSIKNKGRNIGVEGVLLLNVNADNSVATLVVVLNFQDVQAIDLVYLKQVFYKRLLVDIEEFEISPQTCDCSECDWSKNWLKCLKTKATHKPERTTMQDFINKRSRSVLFQYRLQYDIDYRARYSFMELSEPICSSKLDWINYMQSMAKNIPKTECVAQYWNELFLHELYGIMLSDEGFDYVPNNIAFRIFETNYSTRTGYDLYFSGLNALILTNSLVKRKLCKKNHACFEQGYDEPEENIKTEPIMGLCIPGVLDEYFPSFLKAVEVHYLINKIMTNEIAIHERSFLYPWIFIKRLWLLWEILYDVDSHKYHINRELQLEFGILSQLEEIRQEYNALLNHTLSYSMTIITIIAAIFTLIQLWK